MNGALRKLKSCCYKKLLSVDNKERKKQKNIKKIIIFMCYNILERGKYYERNHI